MSPKNIRLANLIPKGLIIFSPKRTAVDNMTIGKIR